MTITASPLSLTRRNAAVSASAWFHTTDPGTFDVDYPTGITGPATVTAAGTRAWGNMGSGGDYLSRLGAEGNARMDQTWLLRIDWDSVPCGNNATSGAYVAHPLMASLRMDSTNRLNWYLHAVIYNANGVAPNRSLRLALSQNSGTNPVGAAGTLVVGNLALAGVRRYAVTITGTTVAIYTDARATVANTTISGISGTMGGSEALIWQSGVECSKINRVASSAELNAWFSAGTIPATDRVFVFAGGQEIDPASPVIYDVSGNATPLDLTSAQVTNWQAPSMRGDTIDTGFSSPLVEVPIVIAADCTAGLKSITLRRTRVGIPARTPALADAVVYDDGAIPVTVAVTAEAVTIGPDVDCQVPSYPATFNLQLTGNYDGAATVVSNNASLVPASPVTISGGVAVVACTVAADVTGATVTATGPGGDTDACSVTVAEVPEEIAPLKIGPSQTLRSGVTSIYLHVTGEDGACTVTASPVVGLSGVPATVTIASGEADLTLTKMSAGTYTITATQGALTDTCTIIVPVGFAAATEYDLVQDIADMVETYGVGYHYDPELLTDTGGDLEDRMFTVRETGVVDGPMIGGKTVTIAVDCYYQNRAPSSDAKALIDYLNCEADAPSYVHALFATGGIVTDFEGAQKITYEIQVSLG